MDIIKVDFHTHSIYSDGTLTLEELRNLMKDLRVKIFSITDHDTM